MVSSTVGIVGRCPGGRPPCPGNCRRPWSSLSRSLSRRHPRLLRRPGKGYLPLPCHGEKASNRPRNRPRRRSTCSRRTNLTCCKEGVEVWTRRTAVGEDGKTNLYVLATKSKNTIITIQSIQKNDMRICANRRITSRVRVRRIIFLVVVYDSLYGRCWQRAPKHGGYNALWGVTNSLLT